MAASCRITVFTKPTGKGKKARGSAYQLWNPDFDSPTLLGSGSLYWPSAKAAWGRARQLLRQDKAVEQVKIETISGREVGRLYTVA